MSCRARHGPWRAALLSLAAGVLMTACALPPAPDAPTEPVAGAISPDLALKPLPTGLAVPPGVAPRSDVPSVRYDLAVSGPDELTPDDGVPGDDGPRTIFQRGGASWYGIGFHMRRTANGERFDMGAMTAAHRTLPFGTVVCVRSLVNGREVLVRINDRGPFGPGRIIDLSRAAAEALDMLSMGIKQVALHVVDQPGMRCNGEVADVEALQQSAPEVQAAAPVARPARKAPVRRRR
ncbi:septal ring lytic transglycosylase RlpA family protein [Variovorax sp. UMC13]|uniref:septal ring lytic transglycosylase RlpA family protein n=1 Tax=Variovorax sp. UMC13 TaxID=1862326 RepID=UPI0021802313|nr:septal ring lytic transglycosylase RlpA family protein [Variovorax sp. UMC13]